MLIMKSLLLLLVGAFHFSFYCNSESKLHDDGLVQIHVLFRHGDRTPNLKEVYPNDPYVNYTYPPLGYGQLTDNGKLREFSIGRSLRERYDRFLGKLDPSEVFATTTDVPRTKLSCQLVLVGLFSSVDEQINILETNLGDSQCHFQKREKDQVMGDPSRFCPEYRDLYDEQATKLVGLQFYNNNKDFYDYILKNTGWTDRTPVTASELYYLLKSQETLGLNLPDWTNNIWPKNLTIRAADEYYVHTATTQMNRIASGHLLQKILDDTQKKIEGGKGVGPKIILYSAHDFNVAFLLILLDQFKPHVPPYGAYITVEVHRLNGVYGIKIYYEDYKDHTRDPLNIEGCGDFCPFSKFKDIFSKYLPITGDCTI